MWKSFAMMLALGSGLAGQVSRSPESPVPQAVFRVDVVARTAKAINYQHRSGSTTIDFKGTQLSPAANGEAKVESKKGYIEIEVEFDDLQKPSSFGVEYLTYVLWAITPEGRAQNLGELLLDGNRAKLNVTTELQVLDSWSPPSRILPSQLRATLWCWRTPYGQKLADAWKR